MLDVFFVLGVGTTSFVGTTSEEGTSTVFLLDVFFVLGVGTTSIVGTTSEEGTSTVFLLEIFFVLGVGTTMSVGCLSEFKREDTASIADCFLVELAAATKSLMICVCSSTTTGTATAFLRPRFFSGAPSTGIFFLDTVVFTGLWKALTLAFMSLVIEARHSKNPSSI